MYSFLERLKSTKIMLSFVVILLFVVTLALGGCGGGQQESETGAEGEKQEKKTYNLKFQLAWHTEHPEYKAYQEFIDRIEEETNGRIEFTLYPADQLVGHDEALDGLEKGTIDMLASSAVYFHGKVPEGDVDWMPFVAAGQRQEFWDFMNKGEAHDIISKAYKEKANAVWLTNILCGSEGIIGVGNESYNTLDKIKGSKLRAAGGVATRTAEALGASPVTIATGELYPAAQRGTIDALIFPVYGMKDYNLYEVCKTYTKPGLFIWCDDLWINQDTFNKLPEDLQKDIQKVAQEWGEWASTEYWPQYLEEIRNWAADKGVKMNEFSPETMKKMKEEVQPVWDWYADESPQCGELVELLREKSEKWEE